MKFDQNHTGSGTFAVDAYRDSLAAAAVAVLSAGHAYRCVSGDHLSGETCTGVIARIGGTNPAKYAGSDPTVNSVIQSAVLNLRNGIGVHKASADHSGGNFCAQVIANAT